MLQGMLTGNAIRRCTAHNKAPTQAPEKAQPEERGKGETLMSKKSAFCKLQVGIYHLPPLAKSELGSTCLWGDQCSICRKRFGFKTSTTGLLSW